MAKLSKRISNDMAIRVAELFSWPSKDLVSDYGVKKKHIRKFTKIMTMTFKSPDNITIGKFNKLQMWLNEHKYGSLSLFFDAPGEQINSPNIPADRVNYISCIMWHVDGNAIKWLKFVAGDELNKICTDFNLRVNYAR